MIRIHLTLDDEAIKLLRKRSYLATVKNNGKQTTVNDLIREAVDQSNKDSGVKQ